MIHQDSIAIHSAQSAYYQYRTPYIPKIFEEICKDLGIARDSVLMDLGCGRGEVSRILSNYAGKIYGVDGSREMISLAAARDNIEYQQVDLNSDNPSIPGKVDHLFFGRSVHWFSAESITRLSSLLLRDEGRIVVCSNQWFPVGEWGRVYFELREKFAPTVQRQSLDFTGQENLSKAGFRQLKQYVRQANFNANISFMIGHTFSTTYSEQLIQLEKNAAEFKQEMLERLKIFEDQQQMIWKIRTWAISYKKEQAS